MLLQSSVTEGRDNSFNLLRMIAAGAVLISHAYPLSFGPETSEPLETALGMTLGTLAVLTFFAISGYFISLSFHNRRSFVHFATARALRIYPGLLCVLVLTALILGPATTKIGLARYLSDQETFLYIPRNLALWPLQFGLPGVFVENPYPVAINGSLWTLVYEVLCYIMLTVVGFAGLTSNWRRYALFLAVYAFWYIGSIPLIREDYPHITILRNLHMLSFPFVAGMTIFQFRDRMQLRLLFVILLALVTAISYGRPWFHELFVVSWSYTIFYIGFLKCRLLFAYNRLGDYSYGMYIYAFPVEQIIASLYVKSTPVMMVAMSMPITVVLAVVSWHFVEERALAQKGALAVWLTRGINAIYVRLSQQRQIGEH
ncbi:acyltransferase family protein [Bradyrhizobium symbiodeficiens]|uniref:acyltransferase family protein n=1 Tax=Bradyrhizobium symbiodeficiens TaxID=1404367 RepID=UPI00140F72EC|nr:acyltransferase [Bradyrhizobium symbiodeficiens]QIO98923.1 acyltransferase [Bradyrhizobium symbiodeficiens]